MSVLLWDFLIRFCDRCKAWSKMKQHRLNNIIHLNRLPVDMDYIYTDEVIMIVHDYRLVLNNTNVFFTHFSTYAFMWLYQRPCH